MTRTCNVSIYVTRSKSLYSPILPPSLLSLFLSPLFFHPPSIGPRLLSQYRVCVYKLSGPRIHINHGCWSCAFHDAPHACIHPSSFLFIRPLSPSTPGFANFFLPSPPPPVFPPPESPIRKGKGKVSTTLPLPSCPVTNSPGIKYIPVVQRPNSRSSSSSSSSSSSLPPPPSAGSMSYDLRGPSYFRAIPSLLVSPYFVSPSFAAFYP